MSGQDLTSNASSRTSLSESTKVSTHSPKAEASRIDLRESDVWDCHPSNPRNWSSRKKWVNVFVVSLYTFVAPLGSSMMAPGLPEIAKQYNVTNPIITALSLVIFLLALAIGPLVLAPLSEVYGRKWVYHTTNLVSMAFQLGCAFAPNIGGLIALRFLSGLAAAAPLAIGGGTVSDLFSERDRAAAMAIYTAGPLFGPAVGPIAGGYITQSIGVRYVFVIIAALCFVAGVIGAPLLDESYGPVIRERLIKSLDAEKGITKSTEGERVPCKATYLVANLQRPFVLLTRSFLCFILSLYMAFMYGITFLMFATFPGLFQSKYGFDVGPRGLMYLGLAIGYMIATVFGARVAAVIYERLSKRNGGKGTPEMRIPALIFGSFFVPVGLFWYGWSAHATLHWIMPVVGSGIFGFGMLTCYLPIQLYLVDTYAYAASALAAAAVFRSLLGFAFPLFADKMFERLGLGGGMSLLAGLSILLGIPFPVFIYYKGGEMRARSSHARH